MSESRDKYQHLLEILGLQVTTQGRLGVAFSGGIDSTFLLSGAVEALGPSRVTAFYAKSTLNADSSVLRMRDTFWDNFDKDLTLIEVEVFPLNWVEFIQNSARRCYFCKDRIYTALKEEMVVQGCALLVDGTNVDDLSTERPGLAAIKEHRIVTPLVEAGLTKQEIRELARQQGLSNHDLPSNSCLATRIPRGQLVTEEGLRRIESAESCLEDMGLEGTRVRIFIDHTLLEVQQKDLEKVHSAVIWSQIIAHFHSLGLPRVLLSENGR